LFGWGVRNSRGYTGGNGIEQFDRGARLVRESSRSPDRHIHSRRRVGDGNKNPINTIGRHAVLIEATSAQTLASRYTFEIRDVRAALRFPVAEKKRVRASSPQRFISRAASNSRFNHERDHLMAAQNVLPEETWIDNYQIVRKLGQGGFGMQS